MKRKKTLLAILISLLVLPVILKAQMQLKSIKPGTAYRYDGAIEIKSDYSFIISREGPQPVHCEVSIFPSRQMGSQDVYPIMQTFNNTSSFLFLAEDEEGIYLYATQGPTDVEPLMVQGKCYTFKYPAEVGTTWEYKNDKGESFVSRIVARETVTVATGNYECLKIEQTGKRDFQGQMAIYKSYEWINLHGPTVKSYVEYQIKDTVIGKPAKVTISLQLASELKK